MPQSTFQLGDYVCKLKGVDTGKMGTVDSVVRTLMPRMLK